MATSPRQLIIVRHAHRDKPAPLGRKADNGISKKGRGQAKKVARLYTKLLGRQQAELISSPKVRCVETLQPLAKNLKTKIATHKALDEQSDEETVEDYRETVAQFIKGWMKSKSPVTIVCSHGDWIPLALDVLLGAGFELKKGGWAQFEYGQKKFDLKMIVQKPGALL